MPGPMSPPWRATPPGLAEARAGIEATGRRCLVIAADMATVDGPRAAAKAALEAWGGIDILVNNAGIAVVESILECGRGLGPGPGGQSAGTVPARPGLAPGMIERRMGKIVNVSSQTSNIALVQHAAYAASKNGLNALTKVMTAEWAQYNVQSNAVCPTVILTPMGEKVWGDPARGDPMKARIPLGRFGKPIEVADLVLFLASSASDMITGETIYIDGGFTAL